MEKEKALEVLAQAVNAANKAGVFELRDSATIFTALSVVGEALQDKREDKPQPKKK